MRFKSSIVRQNRFFLEDSAVNALLYLSIPGPTYLWFSLLRLKDHCLWVTSVPQM